MGDRLLRRAASRRAAGAASLRRAGIPGLLDRPRSGRPPVYGIDDQLLLVATVTETPPEVDSHWTHRSLAQRLHEPVGISASQIGRILASLDVKPHRVRGWLNRPPDPAFRTKAQAVCRLYLTELPADTVLFSVDEKTAMQARSRKRATRPVRAGLLQEPQRGRRGMAVVVVPAHGDHREPGAQTAHQVGILPGAAVVGHLEHVDVQ